MHGLVSDKDQCHSFSAKEATQRQLQLILSVWRRKGVVRCGSFEIDLDFFGGCFRISELKFVD